MFGLNDQFLRDFQERRKMCLRFDKSRGASGKKLIDRISRERNAEYIFFDRPQFQLLKILWVAVSSTVGLRVERHHLQGSYLQNVVLVNQTDENRSELSLGCKVDAVALTSQTFYLFSPLKQHLAGKHFSDDDGVQHEVLLWMRQQPKVLYAAGIVALIKR
ncbi:hypothetical protein AVEN_64245-1 [Araneus ventricosus]|uniref:Uncharacterized protein n=1 Tax=Araneus ventricosus TaxID=182803 RepID=A0A4Y2MN70_ARAVE|nr:hypothetical protein AVEN_64245-1 [Araneus ventricosus]